MLCQGRLKLSSHFLFSVTANHGSRVTQDTSYCGILLIQEGQRVLYLNKPQNEEEKKKKLRKNILYILMPGDWFYFSIFQLVTLCLQPLTQAISLKLYGVMEGSCIYLCLHCNHYFVAYNPIYFRGTFPVPIAG